jgi:hypothetical protein
MSVGWVHQMQSEKYLKSIFTGKHLSVFKRNVWGACLAFNHRFGKWNFPFIVEYFTSHLEPNIQSERGIKIVFWDKPIEQYENSHKINPQKGWLQARWVFSQSRPPTAYIDLTNLNISNYFEGWGHTLKNHRNKWLSQIERKNIKLVKVSVSEFHDHYSKSSLKKKLRKFYGKQMYDFAKSYGENIYFYLIYNERKEVIAGTCIVYDFETKQSIYQYVFTNKSNKYKYIGVGIIDLCIKHTFEKGFYFLNLTAVWEKGQPNSWKGLSRFKDQFNPIISRCYNTYVKLIFKI